jgi:hypothetical protein
LYHKAYPGQKIFLFCFGSDSALTLNPVATEVCVLASRGAGSDHSFINTSLQRGACGAARRQTALAVSLAQ